MAIRASHHFAFIASDRSATTRFCRDLLGLERFGGIGHAMREGSLREGRTRPADEYGRVSQRAGGG